MSRRRPGELNVWPAIADLMLALAVVALAGVATTRSSLAERKKELDAAIARHDTEAATAKAVLAQCERGRDQCEGRLRLTESFRLALERANEIMSHLNLRQLRPSADLTFTFDEKLVSFELNETEVHLAPEVLELIGELCAALGKEQLAESVDVIIEGHADDTTCRGDASCNWRMSAERAASFTRQMERICGDDRVHFRPTGMGSQNPISLTDRAANRRIELSLQPNYRRLMQAPPKGKGR